MSIWDINTPRVVVERRAIEGHAPRKKPVRKARTAAPARELGPLAAEVAHHLRGAPLRFPRDWVKP